MREIICNTSPIQYLYQLRLLNVLKKLYSIVFIPEAVADELNVGISIGAHVPDPSQIDWIKIKKVKEKSLLPLVTNLGKGEKEVIALGLESKKPLLILDDLHARRYASFLNLPITGTLGVLLKGKLSGHINNVSEYIELLEAMNFRLAPKTKIYALKQANEWK